MKAIIAKLVSFVCFHIGDVTSTVMCKFDWAFLYPAYNRLMFASSDIEKWAGIEYLWKKPEWQE